MRKPINMMAEAIIVAQDNADYYAKMCYELLEGNNELDFIGIYEKLHADGYTDAVDEWLEDDPSTVEYLVGDSH